MIIRLRRWLLILGLVGVLIALTMSQVIDFFTVEHPTGRRHSTQEVPITGGSQFIGREAELVLARDLGIDDNNLPNPQLCACSSRYDPGAPSQCAACFVYSADIQNFRIPDFVDVSYIADSKNVRELRQFRADGVETRDFQQIFEFSIAAAELDIPLWIYTRVDSRVDDVFYEITQITGGDVVPYFTYAGYVDPIDQAAQRIGIGAVGVIVLVVIWEALAFSHQRRPRSAPARPAPTPTPKSSSPKRPGGKPGSMGKAESIETGVSNLTERARRRLDEEDAAQDTLDD